jgi:CubicO group peptidase (beta-lactamase class C family)
LDWYVQPILEASFPIENHTFTDHFGRFAAEVTVRHLLCHQGGWVRDVDSLLGEVELGGIDLMQLLINAYNADEPSAPFRLLDPLHMDWQVWSEDLWPGATLPLSQEFMLDVVNHHDLWGQLLAPGAAGIYSNWGYLLAGKVLERWSGMDYEAYIRRFVGEPVGATNIAFGREVYRRYNEVEYYEKNADQSIGSCDPEQDGGPPGSHHRLAMGPYLLDTPINADTYDCVRLTQGGAVMDRRPGNSNLTASAPDLIRILKDLAEPHRSQLLSAASIQAMMQPLSPSSTIGKAFAMGWDEVSTTAIKGGIVEGSTAVVAIHDIKEDKEPRNWYSGLSVCILANCTALSSADEEQSFPLLRKILQAIESLPGTSPTDPTPPWGDYDLSDALAGGE